MCTNCLLPEHQCRCVASGRMSEWGKFPVDSFYSQTIHRAHNYVPTEQPSPKNNYWNYEGIPSENESLTSSQL